MTTDEGVYDGGDKGEGKLLRERARVRWLERVDDGPTGRASTAHALICWILASHRSDHTRPIADSYSSRHSSLLRDVIMVSSYYIHHLTFDNITILF